jgi:hypothetical protein
VYADSLRKAKRGFEVCAGGQISISDDVAAR